MRSLAGLISGARITGGEGTAAASGGEGGLASGAAAGAAGGGGVAGAGAVVAVWERGPDNDPGPAHAVKSSDAVRSSARVARLRAMFPGLDVIGGRLSP